MRRAIKVLYSCRECGLTRVPVQVPARRSENVVEWIEKTCIVSLGRDHMNRSPFCRMRSLQDIMIPVEENTPVGAPVKDRDKP